MLAAWLVCHCSVLEHLLQVLSRLQSLVEVLDSQLCSRGPTISFRAMTGMHTPARKNTTDVNIQHDPTTAKDGRPQKHHSLGRVSLEPPFVQFIVACRS